MVVHTQVVVHVVAARVPVRVVEHKVLHIF